MSVNRWSVVFVAFPSDVMIRNDWQLLGGEIGN
jgi:hypothetical protein